MHLFSVLRSQKLTFQALVPGRPVYKLLVRLPSLESESRRYRGARGRPSAHGAALSVMNGLMDGEAFCALVASVAEEALGELAESSCAGLACSALREQVRGLCTDVDTVGLAVVAEEWRGMATTTGALTDKAEQGAMAGVVVSHKERSC